MLSGSFSRSNQQAKGSIKMELFEAAWLCKAWSMLKYACFSIQDCEVVQASLLFSKHWGGACMQGHSTLICSKAVHVLWETLENTVRQNSLSLRCSAVRYVLLTLIYPNTSFFYTCLHPASLLTADENWPSMKGDQQQQISSQKLQLCTRHLLHCTGSWKRPLLYWEADLSARTCCF